MVGYLQERFQHPWVVLLLLISGALLVLSAVTQAALANDFVSGFFAVYAVLALGLAVFAFLSTQFIRAISNRRHKEFN